MTKQDSATGTVNSTYNNANMLVSAGGSAYLGDADGNTLSGGGRTMSWDSENRMTQCVDSGTNSTSSYVYGADGLRRQATVTANGTTTTTNTIYDATMPVQETTYNSATGQNVLSATYFQGAQGPVYRRDGYNNVSWYVYDGLGSVAEEVSPDGTVTASRKYDVYGAVRSGQAGTSSQKFVGKLGHESDASTGLIYMRARYYDPGTGRFVSQDPKGQGENWFAYCGDDPVDYFDPTGTIFTLIDLFASDSIDLQAADAKMSEISGSWCEDKIYQALTQWASEFFEEIWEESLDGVEWTDNDNLRICGEDGRWQIRVDMSGHDDMPPHINFETNGGGAQDVNGNHWIIPQ